MMGIAFVFVFFGALSGIVFYQMALLFYFKKSTGHKFESMAEVSDLINAYHEALTEYENERL